MSKIPLKTRKSIKTAFEAIEATIKKASAVFGKDLTFIDNTPELFEKLQAAGKSEDYLFELGAHVAKYADQLLKTLVEFVKSEENREQLQAELTSGKVGVLIVAPNKSDVYFGIEDGILWMETKEGWFGSYLDNYNTENLASKLGKNDSMPLNTRKSLKSVASKIDAAVQDASKAFGKELVWVDNYQELYDKLKKHGKGDDYLWNLGNPILSYPVRAAKTLADFCKDSDNREQLEAELSSGKIGVRLVESSKQDVYWCIEDGILWMESKEGWFGSYIDNYNSENLGTKLGKSDSMPLLTRKSLKVASAKINDHIRAASTAFGKELQWVDNYQELYDKLKKHGKGDDWLWKLGEYVAVYPAQLAKAFAVFCKDADNKEALEEVITTGKVGVRIVDSSKSDVYWEIEEGVLWMETKEGWFSSYIDNYNSERLEKKL